MRIPSSMVRAGVTELFSQNDFLNSPLRVTLDGKVHKLFMEVHGLTGIAKFKVVTTEELSGELLSEGHFLMDNPKFYQLCVLIAQAMLFTPEPGKEEFKVKLEVLDYAGNQPGFEDAGAAVLRHVADVWVGRKLDQIWVAFLDHEGVLPKVKFMMDNLES